MAKISIFLIRCVPSEGHLILYNFTLKLHLPYLKLCAFNYPCITKANDRIMLGQYILLTRSLICSWSTLQQTFWFRKFLRNWISVMIIKKIILCIQHRQSVWFVSLRSNHLQVFFVKKTVFLYVLENFCKFIIMESAFCSVTGGTWLAPSSAPCAHFLGIIHEFRNNFCKKHLKS